MATPATGDTLTLRAVPENQIILQLSHMYHKMLINMYGNREQVKSKILIYYVKAPLKQYLFSTQNKYSFKKNELTKTLECHIDHNSFVKTK